jgi:hypothetical protein
MWDEVTFASQGPGGGMGTASHLIQMAMAMAMAYGTSAIVIGAGLIGATRGASPAASSSSSAA